MSICVWLFTCECNAHGVQKRVLDPLQLELQAVVRCLIWMLGTMLQCFARAVYCMLAPTKPSLQLWKLLHYRSLPFIYALFSSQETCCIQEQNIWPSARNCFPRPQVKRFIQLEFFQQQMRGLLFKLTEPGLPSPTHTVSTPQKQRKKSYQWLPPFGWKKKSLFLFLDFKAQNGSVL